MLETDYENYSVVYSCTNLGFFKFHFVWLLTRNAELSDDIKTRAQYLVKERVSDYDFSDIHVTKQLGDCKYL